MTRLIAIFSIGTALLAGALLSFGQTDASEEPMKEFWTPLFNDEGYRTWLLTGGEGRYDRERKIVRVKDMLLQQFTGDERDQEIGRLSSPAAIYFKDQMEARGAGELLVQNEAVRITGEDWHWLGKQNKIVIRKNVHITFYEEIGDLIK